jgi:hypothetical protein
VKPLFAKTIQKKLGLLFEATLKG